MATDTASSHSSATSPAVNPSPFTTSDEVCGVDALVREKQWDDLNVFKRKDPDTSDLQKAMWHAASPSLRKQFSQEPHGRSNANKRQLSVKESNIISVIKELAYNNLEILEFLPPGDSSSLATALRGVCQMQHLVINEMRVKYFTGESMDINCIMEHAKIMHENSSKLIPLVPDLPPVICAKAKALDTSIAKLRLCCFDMSSVSQSDTALASSFENSHSEGAGSLA